MRRKERKKIKFNKLFLYFYSNLFYLFFMQKYFILILFYFLYVKICK